MGQAIRDEVIDELLQGYTSPGDLLGEGLTDQRERLFHFRRCHVTKTRAIVAQTDRAPGRGVTKQRTPVQKNVWPTPSAARSRWPTALVDAIPGSSSVLQVGEIANQGIEKIESCPNERPS